MLIPVWIGRFRVSAPRGNRELGGLRAATVWAAANADNVERFQARVEGALHDRGIAVVGSERMEQAAGEARHPFEVRKLIRESMRQPGFVFFGNFETFEDHAGVRPLLLELKTERLLLRPWKPKDRAPFAEMNADREVMAFQPRTLTQGQSDQLVDEYLADFHKRGFGFLVAQVRSTGAFAGIMGLRAMHEVLPTVAQPAVEIAWQLNRAHQRQGLATEGGKALLDLAFGEFFLDEVVGVTAAANAGARSLMQKLGMQERSGLEFVHPAFPGKHLYAKHLLYAVSEASRSKPPLPVKAHSSLWPLAKDWRPSRT